ncbi:PQQ-binding-like beta-propeller repeat protein [Rhodopirellula sp. SWK7]|uniref:outer membrane protein assembly factor BamB family protein n=1 Tax=Rhodopirellula sp. SWK7 TaxID=595460 RepID=UPI0007C48040|nr:PQQ-binding-like beta-propeller repeat protein [Rhodopirellula sp. SWK7]
MSHREQSFWESLRRDDRTWFRVSAIAVLFSIVVAVAILASFAGRVVDPSVAPEFVELKESLREATGDESAHEAITSQIRTLDVELRTEYFDRRAFMAVGSWLLLGSVFVAIVSAKMVANIRRQAPVIEEAVTDGDDPDAIVSVRSLSAVGGFAVGVFLFSGWLIVSDHNVLPTNVKEVAALFPEPKQVAMSSADYSTLRDGTPGQAMLGEETQKSGLPEEASGVAAPAELPTLEEKRKHWTRFRSTDGMGIAASAPIPKPWDAASGEGILWKSPVELPGTNSPIVWDEHVFLSGATLERRAVSCFDAGSGELIWQTEVPVSSPEAGDGDAVEMEVNNDTGYAAPTMATDGLRVYAMFAHGDVVAMGMDGGIVWTRSFGFPKNPYGHASSLVVEDERVLIQLDQGTEEEPLSKLIALHGATGETVWETSRDVPASWSTPLVIDYEGERQVITCANPWVIAYRASDGEEIWRCDALYQDVGPSPIAADGVLYVCNEVPGGAAIRLGGSGDVTDTHIIWQVDFGAPDTTSPLLVEDMILMLASFGTLTSYDIGEGGDPIWEQDFDDGFKSSPTLIGDRVLLIGESGLCWLVAAKREACETIFEANLGEKCVTSPAIVGGRIFVRGDKHLFCIGES